ENRALPSGPTIVDEIANAAFYTGLMLALPEEYGDISRRLDFDDAKSNFFRAARYGLETQFQWLDGQSHTAPTLILAHLLPAARKGLIAAKVAAEDIDKYLGIIEERTQSRQTGARWILKSMASLPTHVSREVRQRNLTATMLARCKSGEPVHHWTKLGEA